MARDGYRIFDSDTHVGPDALILEPYLSAADQERLARWAPYRATGRSGRVTYTKGERQYRRKLGAAAPDAASAGYMAGFTGVARERQPSPQVDADPAARIADMDYEGVDANLTLPSGWFGTWTAGDDIALELAMYRAYHRWVVDFCAQAPKRQSYAMKRSHGIISLRPKPRCAAPVSPSHVLRCRAVKAPRASPSLSRCVIACLRRAWRGETSS